MKLFKKILKTLCILILILVTIAGILFSAVSFHPQIAVGLIQKASYGGTPINSFSSQKQEGIRDNGQYLISGIEYGTDYANSFMNILYPSEDTSVERPTLIYIHGGGFFGGSALTGDPMAVSNASTLIDHLCTEGFNVVSIDYGLVPDYHFPVPNIQLNQAIDFMKKNNKKYNLNMEHVTIMGSSAGAIMTAQYGAVLTNNDYAKALGIEPAISADCVDALIVDDAPLDYESFTLGTKFLIGNYLEGSIWPSKDKLAKYVPYKWMKKTYPDSFLLGSSEYGHDMRVMKDTLDKAGAVSKLCYPSENSDLVTGHCFIGALDVDNQAQKAYDQLMVFLKERVHF